MKDAYQANMEEHRGDWILGTADPIFVSLLVGEPRGFLCVDIFRFQFDERVYKYVFHWQIDLNELLVIDTILIAFPYEKNLVAIFGQ